MRTNVSIVFLSGMLMVALTSAPICVAQTESRPIEDFIEAQSTGGGALVSWIDPVRYTYLSFDAFGRRGPAVLGPDFKVKGHVKVRRLADGTAHVTVVLETKNAFCIGWQSNADWSVYPIAFGYGYNDVMNSGKPYAIGSGLTRIEFTMPSAEAPLPKFWQIGHPSYPEYVMENFMTALSCKGDLREAGTGYPDGTPGMAHATQVGLYATGVPDGCPPEKEANCFPCEIVEFKPVGN